jgi:acetyl esterase/lipase
VVVGHSLGGGVAVLLAFLLRDGVHALLRSKAQCSPAVDTHTVAVDLVSGCGCAEFSGTKCYAYNAPPVVSALSCS